MLALNAAISAIHDGKVAEAETSYEWDDGSIHIVLRAEVARTEIFNSFNSPPPE